MMDLIDRIHRSAFLGPEFLTWLWCCSEEAEGRFRLDDEQDPFELWFDDRLTVGSTLIDAQENIFRGGHPTSSPEAQMALRQGKMATEARLRVVRGAQEWSFVIKANDLSLSALKIPAVLTKEDDERFYERMYLIEELDKILRGLYQNFVSKRMSGDWQSIELPKLHDWISSQGVDADQIPQDGPAEPLHSIFEDHEDGAGIDELYPARPDAVESQSDNPNNDSEVPPWENPILGNKE